MRTGSIRRIDIDGIPIDDLSFDEAVSTIARWARDGSGGYVYTPNVDVVVKARRLPGFRAAVLGARLRLPDGMGIVYGSRLLGTPLRGTVTGRLLPEAVGRALAGGPPGIGLVGGLPGAAEEAAARLRQRGIAVTTVLAPSLDLEVGSSEDRQLVEEIRRQAPGALFVGFGAPKQALWMAAHAPELPTTVLVGVGSGVDVLAGQARAAPAWMTRVGLEWLFRLVHEPRRLARRYLVEDPRFFLWMLRARLRRRQ